MTYRGHVHNGAVVLDERAALPEGASVEVSVLSEPQTSRSGPSPTFYSEFKDLIGQVKNMPEDGAVNLDHYLYGHPKR